MRAATPHNSNIRFTATLQPLWAQMCSICVIQYYSNSPAVGPNVPASIPHAQYSVGLSAAMSIREELGSGLL